MTDSVALSRRQAKAADRLGGIELVLLWPPELGDAPALEPDEERLAEAPVIAFANRVLGEAIAHHGLVVLGVRVSLRYIHAPPDRLPGYRPVVQVRLVSERYARASQGRRGLVCYAGV